MPNVAKRKINSWPIITVLLVSLAGCATPARDLPVTPPCPPTPQPPSILLTTPPAADFQTRLRDFFLISPESATTPPTTPELPTDGYED